MNWGLIRESKQTSRISPQKIGRTTQKRHFLTCPFTRDKRHRAAHFLGTFHQLSGRKWKGHLHWRGQFQVCSLLYTAHKWTISTVWVSILSPALATSTFRGQFEHRSESPISRVSGSSVTEPQLYFSMALQ